MTTKRLVRAGYEHAAEEYEAWSARVDAAPRNHYLDVLRTHVEPGARLVELGCGTGLATVQLAASYDVIGIDFSWACLTRARTKTPQVPFVQADMTSVGLLPGSIDAVVAFYSLIHVPRDEQPTVIAQAASWLRPGGLLLVTLGADDLPAGIDEDWRGVPMFWSAFKPATSIAMVRNAGFDIVEAQTVPQEEDGKVFSFLWIVARNTADLGRSHIDK